MALNSIGNSPPAKPALVQVAPHGVQAPVVREAADVPRPPEQLPAEQVKQAVESLKELVEAKAPNSLAFSVDNSTGKTIVRISDALTGEMIRQIPSEELLQIARSIDKMQGMLLKQQA